MRGAQRTTTAGAFWHRLTSCAWVPQPVSGGGHGRRIRPDGSLGPLHPRLQYVSAPRPHGSCLSPPGASLPSTARRGVLCPTPRSPHARSAVANRPLSAGPSLKTLCKLAVIQYSLDQSCLPHDIRYRTPCCQATRGCAPCLGALQPWTLRSCFPSVCPVGVLQMGALGHDDEQHHQPPHRLLAGLMPAHPSVALLSLLHTPTSCSTACMNF